jgi:hypothetical protein
VSTRFEVSLRIRHPTADPSQIDKELQWTPHVSHKVGEPRTTPKGNPLPGVNTETFWYVELPIKDGESLSDVIAAANRRLLMHRTYLDNLVSSGGRIEYFVGWFVDGNAGEVLSANVVCDCAALRIQLAFDVYSNS